MKILYPNIMETGESGRISLFVDSGNDDENRDQILLLMDVLMTKPFCYWIKKIRKLFILDLTRKIQTITITLRMMI